MNDTERLNAMIRHGFSILECEAWFLVLSRCGKPLSRWRDARGAIDVAAAIMEAQNERFAAAEA